MTGRSVVLIGGGEHARVLAAAVSAGGGDAICGYLDSERSRELEQDHGVSWLGTDQAFRGDGASWGLLAFGGVESSGRRRGAVERLTPQLAGWANVVHPTAWVAPTAHLGEGTAVLAGAIVNAGASVGSHCIINTGAVIEHDVVLGDHVQVGPRAALGGGVTVGADAYIGLGALVRDHVSIGAAAVVGMGAVVVAGVRDGARVMGVPARERR